MTESQLRTLRRYIKAEIELAAAEHESSRHEDSYIPIKEKEITEQEWANVLKEFLT